MDNLFYDGDRVIIKIEQKEPGIASGRHGKINVTKTMLDLNGRTGKITGHPDESYETYAVDIEHSTFEFLEEMLELSTQHRILMEE